MKQGTFGDFGGDTGGGRPDEEAAAVAGASESGAAIVDVSDHRFPEADGHIECSVTQVDYTIEGNGDEEHPVLHVFGRTERGEPVHARVYDFQPYFYTPISELDLAADADPPLVESDIIDSRLDHDRLTGVETYGHLAADGREVGDHDDREVVTYESIRGEDLVKVFGQTPRDVGELRDRFDHYEADILFPNRLLIDKDIISGVRLPAREADDGSLKIHHTEVEPIDVEAETRVHTLDIEVDDRHGFPEDGEQTIICLTSHDSYRDEYVIWLYESPEGVPGPEAVEGYDPLGDGEVDVDIRAFGDEAEMLVDYLDYFDEETNPDVLTGWNCLPADSEVLMADGRNKEIQNINVGDSVVGTDGETTTTSEVTNKWKSEKRIFDFELADDTTLRTSGEHRVMVGDDEHVDWKRGRNIEPGDYVLKPRTLQVDEPTVPTLRELLPTDWQRYTEATVEAFKDELPHGAVTELSDTFDVSKGTLWKSDPTVWNLERCLTAATEYDVPLPDGGVVAKRTGIPLDREITEHELYLAGLILTDGSMSRADGIRFYNTRNELHEQFPGENHLEPDGKGCYKQNVLDFTMMRAYNGLGIPFGDKNVTDVDLSTVYELPESYIGQFLAGIVDGDGNVASSVTVAAKNVTIGDWYVKLFRRLGIYAERNGTTVRIPDAAREIGRFKNRVLPHMQHSEKVESIESLEGGKSGRSENIPYALFEAEAGSDEKRIGEDKRRRGINLKRHETLSDEWEEYVFVEVETVETTGTETTYDIETTTHDFFADGCLVHNCDDFDAPYLIDRIDRLQSRHDRLDSDRLSRVNEVWDSGWGGPSIKGRVVFDLLYAYQRTQFSELDSYRLDAVGEEELGVGKERYAGDIGDLWEEDPERLLEYNLRDVELCVELDRKQNIVDFWEEVASFVGCKLEDATTPGDAVDMYVLHEIHGEFALPSKGQQESEDYEGGAVFDPISGVKEMVSVLDLKSLYPMCMVTINASPETKVDPDAYDGETYVAPNGTNFQKEPDGMIRKMVDELLEEREQKKGLRNDHDPGSDAYETYDRQQAAVKVIMNSLYGVLGWDRFRLYDKEMGAAVTATGREVIEFTETAAAELDKEVIYGDTDSVMLELEHDISEEKAIEQSFEIEEHINSAYDEFAAELNADEHRFQIEFEKLYRRFFQAGKKKRYAGHIIWKEGKEVDDIDITGFEYKRSDIAPITKEVQKKVLEMIVTGEDPEDIKEYVHDVIQRVQAGKVSLEEIGIPGGIGKKLDNYDTDTAQVRGAKYANLLLGTNFSSGSKPKRLYLKKVHPEFFREVEAEMDLDPAEDPLYGEFKRDPDVICFEFDDQVPDAFEVDYEKMLDKTLKGPIARVLEALDISWEEVKSGQEQTGLGSFM